MQKTPVVDPSSSCLAVSRKLPIVLMVFGVYSPVGDHDTSHDKELVKGYYKYVSF